MSDEEQIESESGETTTRMLTAEYKDGKLQIVEVSPYQKGSKLEVQEIEAQGSESEEGQYMQVLDGDKNVVVDLLNLTLVRCGDGEESYRLVGHGDDTVTCVLAEDDEQEQESYVVVEGGSDQGPLVFLQSDLRPEPEQKPVMSPTEILERAKALQKMKSPPGGARGGRSLPPPRELLASPGFKLFLYSCKLCSFKCNAIKDLTAHKRVQVAPCTPVPYTYPTRTPHSRRSTAVARASGAGARPPARCSARAAPTAPTNTRSSSDT